MHTHADLQTHAVNHSAPSEVPFGGVERGTRGTRKGGLPYRQESIGKKGYSLLFSLLTGVWSL